MKISNWFFGVVSLLILVFLFPIFAIQELFRCERAGIAGGYWFALIAFVGFVLITLAVMIDHESNVILVVISVFYFLIGWLNTQLISTISK